MGAVRPLQRSPTRVYQIAGELGLDLVDRLHRTICRPAPALTLILDVPATVGPARREAGRSSNRFEEKTLAYHERVRAGFLQSRGPSRTAAA